MENVLCPLFPERYFLNDQQTFADVVLDDFAKLLQHGIDHPDMEKVEAMLRATLQ